MDTFLITGIQDIQTTRYVQLSSSTIVIFDHLITFDDEVTLIWNSSWSLGKVLFLINRYYTLCSLIFNNYALFAPKITNEFCLRLFQWQGWTGLVAFMIAEAMLQIRIYALYSLNKKVLVLMLIPYVVCSAYSAWIIGSNLFRAAEVTSFLPVEGNFCEASRIPRQFFKFWIPMMAFESLLCILALFQGFRTFRSDGSLFRSGRRLVSILIRDSVLYFLVIFITYLSCLLIWAVARRTLIEVPVGFSVALSCVLTNRVMLNLRKASQTVGRIIENNGFYDNTGTSFFTPGTLSGDA